jgi:chorismate synthase
VYEGRTTGTPIALLIRNVDQRSQGLRQHRRQFRPGHADYTYWQKYGIRDRAAAGVRPRAKPRCASPAR